MSERFDPYHKWLGIAPEERPPTHYRLLGIPLYEADQEVIASAAVQRMNWLRKFQLGENGADAKRLNKEIADVWACLLNPERKQEYDQRLKTQSTGLRDTTQEAIEEPVPPFLVAVEVPPPTTYIVPPANAPSAAPVFPVTAEPPLSDGVVVRTSGRRFKSQYRRKRSSLAGILFKQLSASVLGLAAGYFILCQINPQLDILKRFSKGEKQSVVNPPKQSPPVQSPKKLPPAPPLKKPSQDTPKKPNPPPEPPRVEKPRVAQSSRLKVPSDEEQKRAKDLISETYKPGFEGSKTREEKIALAGKILKDALDTKDGSTQYAALRAAQTISKEVGELVAALEIADEVGKRFEVDTFQEQLAILSSTNFGPDVLARMQAISAFLDSRWDDALDADRYDFAAGVSKFFASAHRAVVENNPQSTQDVQFADVFSEAAKCFETLAKTPADQNANTCVGRFLCFVLNKWEPGVIRLAKGEDESLRDVAIADLAVAKTATQQVEVADRWIQLAGKDEQNSQPMRKRALDWYRSALPQLTGVHKTRVENLIAEIGLSVGETPEDEETQTNLPTIANDGLPQSAKELEQAANQLRSAKDVFALYQRFLADKTIPDSEKSLANRRLAFWAEIAIKDYKRMRDKWVPPADYDRAKKESIESTSRALALLHSEPQECVKLLEKATRLDTETIQPDFLLALLHAVVGHDHKKPKVYFKKCLGRDPQNISVLNNLAITMALSNEHPAAINYFRMALESAPDPSPILHNVSRATELALTKTWTVTPAATNAYKKLNEDFRAKRTKISVGSRGWLYLLPAESEGEPRYSQLLRGSHRLLIVDDNWIEDRSCVACSGFGKVTCSACGGRGQVSSQIQVPIGKTPGGNTHYQTKVVRDKCNACGGDGTVDCPRCTGGIDPGSR